MQKLWFWVPEMGGPEKQVAQIFANDLEKNNLSCDHDEQKKSTDFTQFFSDF